ncbi:MAG: two-component system regulatory protein YycI [Alicyclobacillus sp.]|nr:two-component system regulatory protein YycI [Alicyclobacillus sp.]
MNWETAKTWLIWMFVVLDTLLGWQVVQSRKEMLGYVESYTDRLANTKTLLAQSGFSLKAPVPSVHPELPSLRGDYARPPLQEIARVAFPRAGRVAVNAAAGLATTLNGTVRWLGDGEWQVTYAHPAFPVSDGGQGDNAPFWHSSDYAPDPAGAGPSGPAQGTEVFVQRYQGYPIFDAQVVVQTAGRRISDFTQSAVVNLAPAGDAKPVISALDALANLASTVDRFGPNRDNQIVRIDLGYARKVSVTSAGSPMSPSNYWFPVWRVVTADQIYYVNAFSGEVETIP